MSLVFIIALNNCLACNCSDCTHYLFEEKNCLVCDKCDVIYKNKPSEHKEQFFNEIYQKSSIVKAIGTKIISRRFWDVVASQYVNYLKQKTNFAFRNVLDVGALYGNFVHKLNEYGINAEGIEADKYFLKYAATDKIKWGYFDENFTSTTKYDLISLTQMLYYVKNPISVLNHAKSLLTENGQLFISTYNTKSAILRNNPDFIESGMNIILSKKNFESLIGFELLDYTVYGANMFLDRVKGKGAPINEIKNYLKFHAKKAFTEDPNGHHAFLLLKPVTNQS